MTVERHIGVLVGAAVAVLTWAVPLMGQYQLNTANPLDASNRIGSGGANAAAPAGPQRLYSPNDIITGNVTAGRAFRGPVGYVNPREFAGPSGSAVSDNFVRGSAGVPGRGQTLVLPNQPTAFYGQRLIGPAPSNFVQDRVTGTYTAAAPMGQEPLDFRTDAMKGTLPRPGQTLTPGQVDPQTGLPGGTIDEILQRRRFQDSDAVFGEPGLWPGAIARPLPESADVDRPKDRVQRSQGGRTEPLDADAEETARWAPNALPRPFESPGDPQLRVKPLQDALKAKPLSAEVQPIEGAVRSRLAASQAESDPYAALRQRLERYYGERLKTDEQAHREFLAALQRRDQAQRQAAEAAGTYTGVGPTTRRVAARTTVEPGPDYAAISEKLIQGIGKDPKRQPASRPIRPEPVVIKSLAAGVQDSKLAEVLREGETLMRAGKYIQALEKYEAAEKVAANNPLVVLGRAHAELAASYYARAEAHLRQALSDPALLMGQYDLSGVIGRERLDYLINDLTAVAQAEKTQSRAPFLLAYIAHNTGNVRQAASYLDMADARAGGRDPFYRLLREHWPLADEPLRIPELPDQ